MPDIEIYSTNVCPYCNNAKSLLKRKGVDYREINVSDSDELREKMIERANGRRTVPQIFIDGRHIGGFDDLAAMDMRGELDQLLGSKL